MLKNLLLLIMILLYTGCAERGFNLTTNARTGTVTAESSVDLSNKTLQIQQEMRKMQDAVKKQQRLEDTITEKKARVKELREQRAVEAKLRQKAQEEQALKSEKVALAKQAEATRLKRVAEGKRIKIEQAKKVEEALRLAQIEVQKQNEARQKAKAEKLKPQRQRELEMKKMKHPVASTQPLKFKLINKIYHKLGKSEVHGHVIFLDPSGQELRLPGTKVYIQPTSAKLNHWYEKYYLKNKKSLLVDCTTVNCLKSTYLDTSKNFKFYGVVQGIYYIIIEAKYPSYMRKDEKVYIAKKIAVEKDKMVMSVFSKKL